MTDTKPVSEGALPISTDQKVWGSNPYGRAQPSETIRPPSGVFFVSEASVHVEEPLQPRRTRARSTELSNQTPPGSFSFPRALIRSPTVWVLEVG